MAHLPVGVVILVGMGLPCWATVTNRPRRTSTNDKSKSRIAITALLPRLAMTDSGWILVHADESSVPRRWQDHWRALETGRSIWAVLRRKRGEYREIV